MRIIWYRLIGFIEKNLRIKNIVIMKILNLYVTNTMPWIIRVIVWSIRPARLVVTVIGLPIPRMPKVRVLKHLAVFGRL